MYFAPRIRITWRGFPFNFTDKDVHKNMKIKIVTDSSADISKEEAEKHQIHIVPMQIRLNGKNYLDRVDITPEEFMKKMKTSKELPKHPSHR